MRRVLFFFSALTCFAFVASDLDLVQPDYFPEPVYNFNNNPLSAAGIDLGRALFYDPVLSKDNTVSCASCHSPYNAFAHTDHDLSHGIDDQIGKRNAPALFNLAWQKNFGWDGAINHLDMQALAPISDTIEMGESLEYLLEKLQHTALYPGLFAAAFGDSILSGERLLKALSQFQLTLVSGTAKYDKVQEGEAVFSEQEQKGYALFKQHCNSCHAEPLFSTYDFANNGLALDTTLNDMGRGVVSKKASDNLSFKIPALRNLSYTYPYMHDGRFRTLLQVLNHYTVGLSGNQELALINLNSNEKTDLIAFLLTLDDPTFVFDQKHQFPRALLLGKD